LARRLTTVLAADVVGYSRLMGEDEASTLAALKALRRQLIKPKERQYQGRTVKLMGDGALMEFPSVVDAVTFAVEVQVAIAKRNFEVGGDRKIIYRMGINIGDIIVEGDDIYGDGVNVASRIEGLCQPGSVCVSRDVYNQVKGKLDLTFEHLGAKEVKNIADPVIVYRIVLDDKAERLVTEVMPDEMVSERKWWLAPVGLLAFLIVAVGVAVWWRPWAPHQEAVIAENTAFPLPDKLSIAVLPFSNLSDDPSQDFFADGMTEDLITDLSKISGLFVIARNSSFSYKGRQVNVHRIAEELGVRYVLEGSVRRAGNEVRINAQLIDASTGGHLWAERYDGAIADVFDLQDKVTERIVAALALKLTPREEQTVNYVGTESVAAHDAYLLGLSFYHRRTPESFAKALTHFEQAIELDPNYDLAYAAIAKIYAQVNAITYARAVEINLYDAYGKARRALAKIQTKSLADVYVVRSWLALRKYQQEQAVSEAQRALDLSPNDVDALEALARAQIFAGDAETGMALAEKIMRQNPTLLARPLMLMGLAEFALGNLDKSVEQFERAIELGSEEIDYAGILAAAHALLGHEEPARTALRMFDQGYGDTTAELARSMTSFPFSDATVLQRLAEGLELAGAKVWFSRQDGGYLPLNAQNKLTGDEIQSLFRGKEIDGKGFWQGYSWQRRGGAVGPIQYSGFPIQPGIAENVSGTSRVDNDLLCEQWTEPDSPIEYCSVIFRVPGGNAQIRWGNYVLVTDTGPNPFNLAQ